MSILISPNHTFDEYSDHFTIDDKIEVFRDRVQCYQLDVARNMLDFNIPNCQLAVLYVLTLYFEMIAKYIDGFLENTQSEKYFKIGLSLVFGVIDPDIENLLHSLYTNLRCGLYHVGFPKPNVILDHPLPAPIGYCLERDIIRIDPPQFLELIQLHFTQYIISLRDARNCELRNKFELKFDSELSDNPRSYK